MTVPTGLAVARDQPLAFASDIGGKRLRQDTRGGLGDEPEETYASALDPWATSCLPWFSSQQSARTNRCRSLGNVYRDHGLGLKSGPIGKDRLLTYEAPSNLHCPAIR